MPRATWFCIDIECSGPVPALYDMISLGAVRVAPDGAGGFSVGEPFYVEIRPTAPRVDAGAMKVNGLDLERLKREGLGMDEALARLDAWVAEQTLDGSEPVFVGHNAPFDCRFLGMELQRCGEEPPANPVLCTVRLARRFLPDLRSHSLDSLATHLGLRFRERHRALGDAEVTADILLWLLDRAAAHGVERLGALEALMERPTRTALSYARPAEV